MVIHLIKQSVFFRILLCSCAFMRFREAVGIVHCHVSLVQDPNIKVKRGDIGQIPKLNQTLGSKGGFKHIRVGDNPPGAHSGSDGSALGLDQPLGL